MCWLHIEMYNNNDNNNNIIVMNVNVNSCIASFS